MSPLGSLVIKSGHLEEVPCHNTAPSEAFFKRLIQFYHVLDGPQNLHPIWNSIIGNHHKNLHDALMASDVAGIRLALEHAYDDTSAIAGLNTGIASPFAGQSGWLKRFEAAAVSLGVLPLFNPEQPVSVAMDIEPIIIFMERVIGCPINHCGSPGMRGVRIGYRFINYNLLESICLGASIRRLVNTPSPAILEIGGGNGMLCFWLIQQMKPSAYHLVDLPTICVLQAYTLKMEGLEAWLRGEDIANSILEIHGLYPDESSIKGIDLVINQDSMPEMTIPEQERYSELIKKSLKPGGIFFSCNHESSGTYQRRVIDMMRDNPNFRQIMRSPSWSRTGYVEEAWAKL